MREFLKNFARTDLGALIACVTVSVGYIITTIGTVWWASVNHGIPGGIISLGILILAIGFLFVAAWGPKKEKKG